jgi:hypothetical protein
VLLLETEWSSLPNLGLKATADASSEQTKINNVGVEAIIMLTRDLYCSLVSRTLRKILFATTTFLSSLHVRLSEFTSSHTESLSRKTLDTQGDQAILKRRVAGRYVLL